MRPDNLPPLSDFKHAVDLQIRFNDIDILGHLNNTVYFSFYDTGKAYFFEHIFDGVIDWQHVESVIANIDCAYIAPIYFGEHIEVRTRCKEVHDKSFILQQIILTKDTCRLKSCAETVMVCYDPGTKNSKTLPDRWRAALTKDSK